MHADHFEFQNYTSLALKKNFVRFGGRLRVDREAENSQSGTNGSFTYASLTYANTCLLPQCTHFHAHLLQNSTATPTGTPTQFGYTVVNVPKIGYLTADLGTLCGN